MLDSPSTIKTTENHLTVKVKLLGPVSDALRPVVVGKQMILTVITILLFTCSPSSVSGLVIPVLVRMAVDGVFERRPGLHVFHEVTETTPTVADLDSTTSVVLVAERQGIVAAAEHALPDSVFERIEMLQSISSLYSWQHGVEYSIFRSKMQEEKMIRAAWKHAETSRNAQSRFHREASNKTDNLNLGGQPMATSACESSLIDLDPETGIGRKANSSRRIQQRERLSGETPLAGGTIVCSHWNRNNEKRAETTRSFAQAKSNKQSQRFDGGGGTLRMDFTDVKFGEGITWDTHIAIDPDRCYGVNPARIDVYELMKFGAYARDTLQMRQYTSGGTYYDQWIGFLESQGRSSAMAICKSPLIDSEAETPTRRKQFILPEEPQRERTSEETPRAGGAMFWTYGNVNRKRRTETIRPGVSRVTRRGCKYDLGATQFGCHWLLSNLDITNLPSPAIAFA